MATRMQQRRGTAQQWLTANPILAAGEIGFETDTNQFKIGDGLNTWFELSYFKNLEDLGGSLDDYILLTEKGANLGVAELNADGLVPIEQLGLIVAELNTEVTTLEESISSTSTGLTNDIATAKTAAEATAQGYVDTHANDTTNVHGISDTSALATKTYADDAVSTHNSDTTSVHGISDTSQLETQTGAQSKADDAQAAAEATAASLYATKVSPAITGSATVENLEITGDLIVGGTTTTVNATDLVVTDPLIYVGEGNSANVVDLGVVASFDNGAYQHTGIVRDATDGVWKLFSSVEDEPTTTINFSQAVYDTLKVGGIEYSDGTQIKVGVPSLTEINQQSGAYTTVLADRDKLVEVSSGSGITVTIPANSAVAYPVGTSIDILQTGAGQVTIAGAGGVTVNATPGLKLRAQWSSATLFKRATDTWVVYGDLSA